MFLMMLVVFLGIDVVDNVGSEDLRVQNPIHGADFLVSDDDLAGFAGF